jgi:hypothetical protein
MDQTISIAVGKGEDVVWRVRETISQMCTPHGEIKSIDVFLNPTPDHATGLCLVEMGSEVEVANAITALRGIRFAGCAGFLFEVRRVE